MRIAIAALSLLAVTACGGGGDTYDDTKAIAEALGCGSSHKIDPPDTFSLGARETATCDAPDGRTYGLAIFRDDRARDMFVEGLGAMGGSYVVGPKWSVGAQTVADAGIVVEKIGGAEV